MIYVFLADGFEEIEALSPVDFLRRAGLEVKTVALNGKYATGSHGIKVEADINISEMILSQNTDAIILPGGMPGSTNLNESAEVQKAIDYAVSNEKLLCAICAAPFILGEKGLLNGKKATCFPGFENSLKGALISKDTVVADGNFITACGAGVAWEFAAEIAKKFVGEEKAQSILRGIQWKK